MSTSWGRSTVLIIVAAVLVGTGCPSPDRKHAAAPVDAGAGAAAVPEAPAAPVEKRLVPVTTASPEALAAFQQGRRLVDVNRESESLDSFRRAITLDPSFALALAYLGYHSSGAEGVSELDRAQLLAKDLPDAERLFIELFAAYRRGDAADASATTKRLLQVAPDEWRVSFELGNQAYDQRDWRLAIAAYRRSMELADLSYTCIGYNNLGYAQAMGEHYELALAALKRCTDLQPNEPNPHDSVGEVALAAGRLDEAAASFQRALTHDPKFFYAWEGIAAVRFFQGEAAATAEALSSARKAALIPADRAAVDVLAAWIYLSADGAPERALQQLEKLETEARSLKGAGLYDLADAAVNRSAILLEAGRASDALAASEVALTRASAPGLPGALSHALLRRALLRKLRALTALGEVTQSEAVLVQLEDVGKKDVGNLEVRSGLHFARGEVAIARKDFKTARAELSRCVLFGLSEWTHDHLNKPEDSLCLLTWARLQAQLGESAGATRTLATLRGKLTRDPVALYVWSRAGEPKSPPAATAPR